MLFRQVQIISRTFRNGLFLVLLTLAVPTFASDQQPVKPERQFFIHQFYSDLSYLLHQPDFYVVVGGLSATPVMFHSAFGREENEFGEMWGKSRTADEILDGGEFFGNGIFPFSLSVSSWGLGKIIKSEKMQAFGTDLFRSEVVTSALTLTMKRAINRTRPDGTPYSYPSGHTSTAFATAGVVYKHFGKFWGIPAFAAATYVGLYRMQENKHYLSDVIAGGILGTYVSLKLTKHDTRGSSLFLSPFSRDDANGLALLLKF